MSNVIAVAAAEPWYASGNFWTGVGVAVGALAVIVSITLWRFGVPRAVLEYSMPTAAAMISSQGLVAPELKVTLRGRPVGNPYIMSLRLVNRSRRDIRSTDFDQKVPLTFELGVPVLELLAKQELGDMPIAIQGSEIVIGPMLIRSRQKISIDVLTDGKPKLECHSLLADTTVRQQPDPAVAPGYVAWPTRGALVILIAALIVVSITAGTLNAVRTALIGGIVTLAFLIWLAVILVAKSKRNSTWGNFVPLWPGQRPHRDPSSSDKP